MVGSITFTKNEGDYVHKGDEVLSFYFDLLLCSTLRGKKILYALNIISFFLISQFGYFSFGGSTVICVFEKVCLLIHASEIILFPP